MTAAREEDWLWGWDDTPGIVSVHADAEGRALVWRRIPGSGALVRDEERYRPWLLLDRLDDLAHLGAGLAREGDAGAGAAVRYRELDGPGALRFLVSANDGTLLTRALLRGASERLGRRLSHVSELPVDAVLSLPPDEQYLVATGRTYFRGLAFDELHRLQFDLETSGLDARHSRIFMISVREHDGRTRVLEAAGDGDAAEGTLIRELVECIQRADPDVIENHNLHGFDLPFLELRARRLGVPLTLGRVPGIGLRQRAARRGVPSERSGDDRRMRWMAPGRELIDTLDAVRRFGAHDLPGMGLKVVAKHLGIASPEREYIRGDLIHETWTRDPARVRRYATDDVIEVAAISRMLGGAAYALAQMAPRRYERLADTGAATGVIDPMLVRAYLREGAALPAHEAGDGTPHSGAALHLFATGVAQRIVKADVASLYPSLMRAYRIGPARDRLGVLLSLVDRLVERRLHAKAQARLAAAGSAERHAHEAMSSALKIVVNSAYGYLAAGGNLTRFADVHAANEVTRRGREVLALLCRELAARGVTLIEADTDGVYFAVPEAWTEADERRVVREVGALLPPLVQLELEGRYAAMLSHEPKNYALLGYDGSLVLRGVAFRSSRSEPYGDRFLRRALGCLLRGDVAGVRHAFLDTITALRARALPTWDVASRARLTKSPAEYAETRRARRELPYEALLAGGRPRWSAGDRVHVYRRQNGEGGVVETPDDSPAPDPRDYDVGYYERLLRSTYAARLARAFTAHDFGVVFADADQHSLFDAPLETIHSILATTPDAVPPGE